MMVPSDLDLNLLRALDALLTEAHVTRAALRLGLTQSATSRALGRLREAFGDPLLVRTGRGLRLTARGDALRVPVSRILAEIEALTSVEPFDPASTARVFRLAADDYHQAVLVPALQRRLDAEAPDARIEIDVRARHPVHALGEDPVDVVLDVRRSEHDQPGIVLQTLFEDRFAVLLRRGHPALSGPWTAERYAACDHVLVAPGGRPGGPFDAALSKLGLTRRVGLLVPSFNVAPLLVASSDRVTALPSRLAVTWAAHLPLVLRPPPLPVGGFTMVAVWHERHRRDPGHAWFRRLVREAADTLPAPEAPPSGPANLTW